MSAENPVSPKVVASTAGAGIGAALSSLAIWIVGVTLWGQSANAADVNAAVAAVPAPVSGVITLIFALIGAGFPGWKTTDPNRVTTSELATLQDNQSASSS